MKALLTKEFAEKHVISPLRPAYNVFLVGSVNDPERQGSYNDIDIAYLYERGSDIWEFQQNLMSLGWVKNKAYSDYQDQTAGDCYTKKFKDKQNVYEVNLEVYYSQNFK